MKLPFRMSTSIILSGAVSIFAGCADLNSPYGSPYGSQGSYGNYPPPPPYYGNPGYSNYPSNYGNERRERKELERERERLEAERQRLEEERRRQNQAPPPVYRPPPVQERCPAGFSPSEQKCSREERKRGCQDMRLSSGLGCVRR